MPLAALVPEGLDHVCAGDLEFVVVHACHFARVLPPPADVHLQKNRFIVLACISGVRDSPHREPFTRFVDLSILDRLESEGFFERLERQYALPPGLLPGR